MTKSLISKTICVIPWLHLNIIPSGKVIHCCMTSDMSHTLGDLAVDSLEEIWNSDNMRAIRREMLEGGKPRVCSKCYEREESSGGSHRLLYNRKFFAKLFEIPKITDGTGHVDKIDLKYWDFRFSNLCNYKCRVCGPESSSAWVPDAKKLGRLSEREARKILRVESVGKVSNLEFVKKYLHQAERIYFAGGEPLLMDEHWEILDMLDAQQKYEVEISYNTNLSTLSHNGKHAADYWRKWGRKISVCPSIDEIGERAELIRAGTAWKNLEANLKILTGLGVRIWPNITVSAFNVFRLPEILDRLIDLGVIRQEKEHFKNFTLNLVEQPVYYHVSVLPQDMRDAIIQRLLGYIAEFKNQYQEDPGPHFAQLFRHLKMPGREENVAEFRKLTEQLDALRGEKTAEVVPELKHILG